MVAAHREIREKAKTLLPKVVKLIQTMKDEKPVTLEDSTVTDIKNLAELALEKVSSGLKDAISTIIPDLDNFSGKSGRSMAKSATPNPLSAELKRKLTLIY